MSADLRSIDQALASFSGTKANSAPVTVSDIGAYRSWMEDEQVLHESETHFLSSDHEDDLVCPSLGPPSTKTIEPPSAPSNTYEIRQLVFLLYITMVILLLAFSMLPGLLSKVFLLCIVVACTGSIAWRDIPQRPHASVACLEKDT